MQLEAEASQKSTCPALTGSPEEETEAVRRHLTRKYGLRWWDNGFHDIDHLLGRKRDPDLGRKASGHNKL